MRAFEAASNSGSLIKSVRSINPPTEDNVESSVINKGGCSDRRRGAGIDTSLNSKGRKPCRVDSRDSAQTYFHVTSIPFIDSIFARSREKESKGENKRDRMLTTITGHIGIPCVTDSVIHRKMITSKIRTLSRLPGCYMKC